MVPGDSRWYQLVPGGFRWYQVALGGSRWYQVVPGGSRQVLPGSLVMNVTTDTLLATSAASQW